MKQEFRVVVESPYGKQPIEQFYKHLQDMASEALTRWGIEVQIQAVNDPEEDVSEAFEH